MNLRSAFLIFALLATGLAQTPTTEEDVQLEHFDPQMVDRAVEPCTDFFQYACNVRLKNSPMPADEIFWGSFSKIAKWNDQQLHKALDEVAAKKSGRSANEQKIGDYYSACMDQKKIDADGIKSIQSDLTAIDRLRSVNDLAAELAILHSKYRASWLAGDNQTNTPPFGFGSTPDYDDTRNVVAMVDQGGLGLPNRDFYLKDDDKSKKIRAGYLAYITKMLGFTGIAEAQAQSNADAILKLETTLATAQMDNITRRDPKNLNNRFTLAQLKALTPSFDWDRYLKGVATPATKVYIVTAPGFF